MQVPWALLKKHTEPQQRNLHSTNKDSSSGKHTTSGHIFWFLRGSFTTLFTSLNRNSCLSSQEERLFLNKSLAWCFRDVLGVPRVFHVIVTWRKASDGVFIIPKSSERTLELDWSVENRQRWNSKQCLRRSCSDLPLSCKKCYFKFIIFFSVIKGVVFLIKTIETIHGMPQ